MNLHCYGFTTESTHLCYDFISENERGRIRKSVLFMLIDPEEEVYNIAFGDYNELTGEVDDLSISNNHDGDKVLLTVAAAVFDFSRKHPNAVILAIGSTAVRMRLYRMKITKYYENISTLFDVEGYSNGWQPFQPGIDYEAFLITRKNS